MEDAHDLTEAERPRRRSINGAIGWAALILGLYVLSPPPLAYVLMSAFPEREEDIEGILRPLYSPLQWLYDNYERVERFYDWYGSLFSM